jgi:hypothetical protein
MTGASRSATTVRVERIKDTMTYNSAFDFLTKFYQGQSDEPMEIDLTADDDDEEAPTPISRGGENGADNVDVATGLPGECVLCPYL